MERPLSIFEELRVVEIVYNPYDVSDMSFQFAKGPLEYYGQGIDRIVSNIDQKVEETLDELDRIESSITDLGPPTFEIIEGEDGEKEVIVQDPSTGEMIPINNGMKFRTRDNYLEYTWPAAQTDGKSVWFVAGMVKLRIDKTAGFQYFDTRSSEWLSASGIEVNFRISGGTLQYFDTDKADWVPVGTGVGGDGSAVIIERLI